MQLAGFYPVSNGIDKGLDHLKEKVNQGYSLMVFPEGTRSKNNKIKRFHKGAFYLADQFNLDIIPVLIHGNSEIIPKGSSVIRNGSLTLKILDRITLKDQQFSENYSKRAKQIGTYFKSRFGEFRKERERSTYFHKILLDEYRYKGDALFKRVQSDIEMFKDDYETILNAVGKKDTIIHLSKDVGQLDFLLSLHSVDRKLITFIEDDQIRLIVKNSYISNNLNRINLVNSRGEALKFKAETLVIGVKLISEKEICLLKKSDIIQVVLLKESRNLCLQPILDLGFDKSFYNDSLIILTKKVNRNNEREI